MFPDRAILIACLMLAPGIWFGLTGHQVVAQQTRDSPLEVTTDTPEYCAYLQGRIHSLFDTASSPPRREAKDLSTEGKRMCDHGQTRAGIMRLRQALIITQHDEGTAQR